MINLQKLEKWFFYLLIFFLPWQARIIFKSWGASFNEWNSAAIYLTDVLLVAIIFLWLVRISKKRATIRIEKTEIILFIFFGIGALSFMKAENFWLGLYRLIKLFEFGVLFLYIKNNLAALFNFEKIFQIFVASGLLQALIAISQFVRQKSFGLSFLDESPLSPEISGVAKIVLDGVKMIRPYGLTPHPNVLAAFLVLAIFCALFLFTQKNKDYKWGAAVFYSLAIAILTFTLFLTFSRSVIVVGLAAIFGCLVYAFFKSGRRWFNLNTIVIFVASCALAAVFLWPFLSARFDVESSLADQSINLRVFYNQVALDSVEKNPFLGVGVGNFVWTFQNSYNLAEAWMYQPVHNIYLLISSEIGAVGLLAFLVFLFFIIKSSWRFRRDFAITCFLSLVTCLMLLGLFDHFLWDLQQGQLMLWIVLGMLASFAKCPYGSTDRAQPSGG